MSLDICDIDFTKEGAQIGRFHAPCPRNTSAWGTIPVPIGFFKKGEGEKILLTAGAHGDEYEGPITLIKIMKRLQNVDFQGQITIVPGMNIPALGACQRLSPLDGQDLNRSFPDLGSGVTARITEFISEHLIPRANVVVDLHSGGNSLDFLPAIIMHDLQDQKLREQTLEALKAFGGPYGLILEEIDAKGMLDSYVEKQNKLFLTTELRGGGKITPYARRVGTNGIARLLHHFGNISSLEAFSDFLIEEKTEFFEVPDDACFIRTPERGIFEPWCDLGEDVKKSEQIGEIHFLENPERDPLALYAKVTGKVLALRPKALTEAGDSLFMIGRPS